MDLADAERKIELAAIRPACRSPRRKAAEVVGIIPVHVGGVMMDMAAVHELGHGVTVCGSSRTRPTRFRPPGEPTEGQPWQRCGEGTSTVSCFSFYANKTITTGEGGMAVTDDAALADRMRMMSLHGLSHDAWDRYSGGRSWDYQIVEAGYKYNMTDVAAAIGVHQLERAEAMRLAREAIAMALPGRVGRPDRKSNCPPCRKTASTPGTCSRSGCGSIGWRSTATR